MTILTEDLIDSLSEEDIYLVAANYYRGGNTMKQFHDDWAKVSHARKLLGKRRRGNNFNARLFLNHIVILGNTFGPRLASLIIFCKTQYEDWPVVKSALLFLSYMSLNEMPRTEPDIGAWKEFKAS